MNVGRAVRFSGSDGVLGGIVYWLDRILVRYDSLEEINSRADVFALVLKIQLGDRGRFRKQINTYANVLRHLYSIGTNAEDVAKAIRKLGGIRKCSVSHSRSIARAKGKKKPETRIEWETIRPKKPLATFRPSKGKLAGGRCAILGFVTKNGILRVYQSYDAKSSQGEALIRASTAN